MAERELKRARKATPVPATIAAEASGGGEGSSSSNGGGGSGSDKQESVLQQLRLRRIVKENHGKDVVQVAFDLEEGGTSMENMVATIGGTQLNVYDNEHGGDHLDLVSHYVHTEELLSVAWVHTTADVLLALGCADGSVVLVSVTRSRVERVFEDAHKGGVTEVVAGRGPSSGMVWSTGRDDTIKCWSTADLATAAPAPVLQLAAKGHTTLCLAANGALLVSASGTEIVAWKIAESLVETEKKGKPLDRKSGGHVDKVVCSGSSIVVKMLNGKFEVFDASSLLSTSTFVVKGSFGQVSSRFDISSDHRFLCVGDNDGVVHISIAQVTHKRLTKPIRACVFSQNMRNVLLSGSDALIWRYDYIDAETLAEWATFRKEKEKTSAASASASSVAADDE